MKQLITLLATLLSSLVILVACTKGDHNDTSQQITDYYFKFNLDETTVNYDFKPESQINLTGIYVFDKSNQLHVIQITGSDNIFKPNENQFIIYLNTASEFKISTAYSNASSLDTETPANFLMGYYNKNGEIFTASVNSQNLNLWKNCYVTFDEITEDAIKGTFSGELLRYDTSTGQNLLVGSVTIKDGKFYVPGHNE